MKDKEKQIYERAVDILYDINDLYKDRLEREQIIDIMGRGGFGEAVELAKKGYRKIDKDSVVLTRKEYESDLTLQYDTGYEFGSKETAEKIYRELQGHGTTYVKKWIKEQFGVEIKE